jgi:hypothetical protein
MGGFPGERRTACVVRPGRRLRLRLVQSLRESPISNCAPFGGGKS